MSDTSALSFCCLYSISVLFNPLISVELAVSTSRVFREGNGVVSVRGACVVVAASVMLAVALVGISGDIEAEPWAVIVELTVIF